MTNKEFFLKIYEGEYAGFVKVLKAFDGLDLSYKPHEKARSAGKILFQLACQPFFISAIATKGAPDWSIYKEPEKYDLVEIEKLMAENFDNMKKDLATVDDHEWESMDSILEWPGGRWQQKRFEMAWGFFLDAVHHRGQLTTYLRAMGAKVPGVYGGSADEAPVGN